MPELPEVETTLRGIEPHITHKTVKQVIVRQGKLRWQVPADLSEILANERVESCTRRAKYLLIHFKTGVLLIHLGMSGSLRIFTEIVPEAGKHDHIDFVFDDDTVLRYHDPRRFGAVLWHAGAAEFHPLLQELAAEPLSDEFHADALFATLQKRQTPIKTAIMDNKIVVGVGNIYANESLFLAGILPTRPANKVSKQECRELVKQIKIVLQKAIAKGGSTLRDFVNSDGKSGYFQQEYTVYGRHDEPCTFCGTSIAKQVIAQRASFYCPKCQK
ncbi:MAG: bifunctional DNA-formamidopyrimidine glycosylase/DNA-(apurinic or apyrimidinic site) lyase [Neisseria sp.]|nr:bifunctional DNA-formamidopyrimidine glycosylase/DNA-(apurinic or apyrimidinic site) lyase [Neisseria sp.]